MLFDWKNEVCLATSWHAERHAVHQERHNNDQDHQAVAVMFLMLDAPVHSAFSPSLHLINFVCVLSEMQIATNCF